MPAAVARHRDAPRPQRRRGQNLYIDYCRKYTVDDGDKIIIYENNNKTLAHKKSSIPVMFKQLYRDGFLEANITDGFDPIRVPKPGEREIKALQDDEVMVMLDAVTTGSHLTPHERKYWEKTRLRDKAILTESGSRHRGCGFQCITTFAQ